MPRPLVAPLSFGWFSLCLAPHPRPLVVTPPGAASHCTPLCGWFVALPRALTYHTDGCRVASCCATASCASTPLVRDSARCCLLQLLPPHLSHMMSTSPEWEQGLPEHCRFCCRCSARPLLARGLPCRCRHRGCPCSCLSPARGLPRCCRRLSCLLPGCGSKEGASLSG
jgi:hypothetical protein